ATGLELGYGTPRRWLAAGKRVAVTGAPTRFGRVSFTIEAHARALHVTVEPAPRGALHLRLRLPSGRRIASVARDGRPYRRFDADTGTIDLSGLRRGIDLVLRIS